MRVLNAMPPSRDSIWRARPPCCELEQPLTPQPVPDLQVGEVDLTSLEMAVLPEEVDEAITRLVAERAREEKVEDTVPFGMYT